MQYQITLDSNDYYSSLTGATLHSHRVYGIDWSFLPENKRFRMTFKIVSKTRTTGAYSAGASANRLRCSFEGIFPHNLGGCSQPSRMCNNFIGLIVIRRASNTTNDSQIRTFPHHNPPTYLPSRPSGNFITIEMVTSADITNTAVTGSYLMTLYFEEID